MPIDDAHFMVVIRFIPVDNTLSMLSNTLAINSSRVVTPRVGVGS